MVRKTVFFFLILVSLLTILARFLKEQISEYWNKAQVAGLKVISEPVADVFIDNIKVGKTPYEDKNLESTTYLIKLENQDNHWEGKVNLKSGTVTVVNRELGKSLSDSSGEVLTLEKGSGVSIISNPDGATVEIDGRVMGKTPGKFDVGVGD